MLQFHVTFWKARQELWISPAQDQGARAPRRVSGIMTNLLTNRVSYRNRGNLLIQLPVGAGPAMRLLPRSLAGLWQSGFRLASRSCMKSGDRSGRCCSGSWETTPKWPAKWSRISCRQRNPVSPRSTPLSMAPPRDRSRWPAISSKGSASLVGAHQLTALCAQLETAGESNDWPAIHSLTPRLEELMRDIEISAEAFLRSQTPWRPREREQHLSRRSKPRRDGQRHR